MMRIRSDGAVGLMPSGRFPRYVSSRPMTHQALAEAERSHWAIENSQHRVLDVTFGEDAKRNRADNDPAPLAILRRLALNLLRKA